MSFEWTPEQKEIIDLPIGNTCVLACAGSGKTSTVVERITKLATSSQIDPDRVAIITFTRLAAEELRTRISSSFEARGIAGFPFIGTIHGFCLNLIKAYDPENGEQLQVLSEGQQFALFYSKWKDWDLDALPGDRGKSYQIHSLMRSLDIFDIESVNLQEDDANPELLRVRNQYNKWLLDNNFIDYSGILRSFNTRLDSDDFREFVLQNVSFLIVDEYQDTDPIQASIFAKIGSGTPVMVVGDDDQCIYQFRGTTPQNILNFSKVFDDAKVKRLSENFRCASSIVDLAQARVEQLNDRATKRMRATREGGSVIVNEFATPMDEAKWLASEIDDLITTGKASGPDQIAILLRSTSSSAIHYVKALQSRGIPFVVKGDGSLLDQGEVSAAIAGLELVQRETPTILDISLVHQILGKPLHDASSFSEETVLTDLTEADWSKLGSDAEEVGLLMRVFAVRVDYEAQRYGSCLELFTKVLVAMGAASETTTESIHRNWAQLTQIVKDYDDVVGGRNVRQLLNYLRAYGAGNFDAASNPPDEKGAVSILTIHRSKGLEFQHVFMPMMVEGRFPSPPRRPDVFLDTSADCLQKYAGSRDDEVRLFYVAVTRAMERLYFSSARKVTEKRQARRSSLLDGIEKYYVESQGHIFEDGGSTLSPLNTSYSRIEYYLSCPYRYKLLFEIGYATPQNPFFSFGRILHLILRLAHEAHASGTPLGDEEIERLFDKHFASVRDVPVLTLKAMRRRGLKALKAYKAQRAHWLETTFRTELPFTYAKRFALSDNELRVAVSGQADLILEDGDGCHVIDFKSGKPHPYIRTDLQLKLYSLGLKQAHDLKVKRATVYYVEHDEAVEYTVREDWLQDGIDELATTAEGIAKERFSPTPGRVCGRCEVRPVCPFGGK